MYTFTLYIEKYPVDSNVAGLVSETHKHRGREWNLKKGFRNGLIEI